MPEYRFCLTTIETEATESVNIHGKTGQRKAVLWHILSSSRLESAWENINESLKSHISMGVDLKHHLRF